MAARAIHHLKRTKKPNSNSNSKKAKAKHKEMAFLSTSNHCISTSVFPKTPSPKTTPSSLSFSISRPKLLFKTRSIPFFQVPNVGKGTSDEPVENADPVAAGSDPPLNEAEEKEEEYAEPGDVSVPAEEGPVEEDEVGDLKRSLVDAFYGTYFGLRDNPEVRAEVSELVNKLETLNPSPSPVEGPKFDGTWVLL